MASGISCIVPGRVQPVTGTEARERNPSPDGRMLKIVLDGKSPITEGYILPGTFVRQDRARPLHP